VVLVDETLVHFRMPGSAGANRELVLHVASAGRGPALNVEGRVVAPENLHVTKNPAEQSLPVGESNKLRWSFLDPQPPVPVHWGVTVTYSDLSDRRFETSVAFTVSGIYTIGSCEQVVRRVRSRLN
jgi:hypothetical protein